MDTEDFYTAQELERQIEEQESNIFDATTKLTALLAPDARPAANIELARCAVAIINHLATEPDAIEYLSEFNSISAQGMAYILQSFAEPTMGVFDTEFKKWLLDVANALDGTTVIDEIRRNVAFMRTAYTFE